MLWFGEFYDNSSSITFVFKNILCYGSAFEI